MDTDQFIRPPGTYYDIIAHPVRNEAMEVAVVQDHRFAFYYWVKWNSTNRYTKPVTLVSLDWHTDLSQPDDTEKAWLKELDLNNYKDVALYSWDKLSGANDNHILSAAKAFLFLSLFFNSK